MKKLLLSIVFAAALTMSAFGQATYTWKGGSSAEYSASGSWSPARTTVVNTDILIFDLSNINGSNTLAGSVSVNNVTNETIGQLQIIQSGTASARTVTFTGTTTTLTISGNLTINTSCTLADGGNVIKVGGNIVTNATSTTTLHSSSGSGKIVMTGLNPSLTQTPSNPASITVTVTSGKVNTTGYTISNGGSYGSTPTVSFSGPGTGAAATVTLTTGAITALTVSNQGSGYTSAPTVTIVPVGNMGFGNLDIGDGSNATNLTLGAVLQINGNINIYSNATLSNNNKTFILNSTNGIGGTISGTGTIIATSTSGTFYIQGTGGATPQTVGTLNFNTASAANSTINTLQILRPNATTTIGTCNSNTLNISGGITITSGTLNDGGNAIKCGGSPILATGGSGVITGTGKIQCNRANVAQLLCTAGGTFTVGNIEIMNANTGVYYTLGTATNLTINGTLTLSTPTTRTSGIDASGATLTFQNGNTPIVVNTIGTAVNNIKTDASTNLKFGSAGNTAGNAFTIPNDVFTTAPSIASFTVNRDNALTFNNQTLTVSGATTITAGTLAMATQLTANGAVTVNGTFQLNSGGWATGSGTWTYGGSSTLAFNNSTSYGVNSGDVFWPTSSGPQNVSILQGGLTLNSGANRTVSGTFQTAAAVTINSATLTLNGTTQINNGGSFANAPIYGSNSTLKYNSGTTYGRATEWSATTGTVGATAGLPQSVQISNNTTLNYPNGSSSPARTLAGSLTIDAGSSFYMDYGSPSSTGALTVGGNTTVNGNLSLGNISGGDIYVAGNWSHGVGSFNANSRALFMNGGSLQTISNSNSTNETFPVLFINNTSGGVTLNSPVTVTNTFTITSGIVTTTSTNLLTITNTSNSAISGGSSTKFINGPVAWTLPASSASTYVFPVGSGTSYYPLSLASPTTSTSGTTVAKVQAVLSSSGGSADLSTLSSISSSEYWSIAASVGNITGGNLSLTRTGVSIGTFDKIGASSTLTGTYSSIGGTVSDPSINSSNNISTISAANSNYYVLGVVASTDPAVSTITGGPTNTSGYIGQTLTINGSNFSSGATVSFNGGSAIATSFVSAIQLTVVVPANATSGNIVVTSSGKSTAGYSYTILGYVSSADGDWNTNGTWTNNTIPPAGSTVTISNAVTVNSAVTNSPASISIGGGSLTFGASGSLGVTNFTISSGTSLIMTNGGSLNIASGGSMTNNSGTFTYGTGTIAFAGTGSFSGVTNLNNVTIAGGVNFSGTTINGILTINSGGYVDTTAPTYASGSTLKYNTGGTYGRTTEWTTTTGAGYPANVQLSNNTLLDIGANSGGATVRQISGDLNIDSGSTLTMAGGTSATGTQAMTAALTVLGSVANSGTLTLSGSAGGDIKVGSNWTNSGTFTPNLRAAFFTGSGATSINSATNFDYLLISKTSATVTLGAACTVNQDLTLTSGSLDYATYTLTVAGNVAVTSGTLTTASAGTLAMTGTSKTIAALALGNLSISGTTNTVTASGALSIANGKTLTINSGNTLAMSTFALTAASGSFTPAVNGTLSTANTTATPIPAYDWTNGNTATGTVSFGGTGTIPASSTFYNLATTASAVYGNGTITIYGNFSPAASSTATQGTLVFANTTATQSTSAFTFKNLTVNNTSANGVQASGNISVSATGTLTIGTNAILDLQANALSTLGTTSGSGTLKTSNTTATPIVASKTYAFLVEYTNTSGGQTVPTGVTLNGGLQCDNTSNSVTAAGNLYIGGKLTMASTTGTFDLVGFTLSNGSTSFDASSFAGTFKTSAGGSSANQFPSGVTWADNSTVIYYANAGSNTRLTPASYYNLDADNGRTQSLNFDYASGSTASFTVRNTFTAVSTQVNARYTTFNFTGTGQNIPAWTFYNLSLGTNSVLPSGTVTVYGTFNPGTLTSASQGTILFSPVPYNAALGLTIPAFTYKNLTITGNVNTISNKSGSTYNGSPAIAMNTASDVTGLAANEGITGTNLPSNAIISGTSNTVTTSYLTTPYYIVNGTNYYLSYPNNTNTDSQTDWNNTASNQAVLTGTGGATTFNGVYVKSHFGAQTGSTNFSATFTNGSTSVTFTKNSSTSGLNAGMIVTTTNPNVSIPDGTYIQSASAASGSGPYTFTVVLSAAPTVTGVPVTDQNVMVGSVNILSGALSGLSSGTTYGNTTNPNFSYSPGIVLSANATGSGSVTDISTYGINVTVPTGVAVSGLFTDNHTGNFNLVTNTGAVNLNSGATISTGSGTTYYSPFNITLASGATATAAGNLYFGGTVTVPSNATLNMSTYTLNAGSASGNSFSPSISGTLKTISTSATSIPSGQTYGGTVEYAATGGGQTIPLNTYNNLTVSNTSGTQTLNANATAATLTINSSGSLSVAAGKQLTVSTSMTNGGTLNLLSTSGGGTATILTPDVISGSGTTNVSQFLAGGRNWYVSSPVTGANATTVLGTSTATTAPSYFTWYDETLGSTTPWTTETSTLTVSKGYIAINPASPATQTTDGVITFNGTLNNGSISTATVNPLTLSSTGVKDGFNLVGNPYPSYVDWNQASKTNLNATMWYRTKEGSVYKFYTYNGTSAGYGGGQVGVPANVSNLIPPMQAFWVRVENGGPGSLAFTNTMRSHLSGTNPLKVKAVNNTVQPLLRLQVSNTINTDEAVVYFNANASNSLDAFDSPKMTNANAAIPEIYTTVNNENLVINGMNSIPYDTEIALGFTPGSASSFSIKASEVSNFETGTQIFLKDYATGTIQDITDGTPYTFVPDNAVAPAQRFTLLFKAASISTVVNSVDGSNNDDAAVIVTRNANNYISVNCVGGLTGENSVAVYNELGKKLLATQLTRSITVLDNQFVAGVYMVVVKNGGKSVTQKVILN